MYSRVKGTFDLLPEQAKKITSLENYLRSVASLYGYDEIRVPILVPKEVIHRSSGETSDIVTKETFDLLDRGNRELTLRPEGTAPILRAVIENKMYVNALPLKLFYLGDMFRYERPQKGRYREFSQFGVEVIGANSPLIDAEIITLASTIFGSLRIKNYKVRLNTLGDKESRENYKKALMDYFSDKLDSLCEDCKKRYLNNPLRILDCKVDKDSEVLKNVPKIENYLNENSIKEFSQVKEYLDMLNVPYVVDSKLVRGLDYYTNTIFEIEIDEDNSTGQSLTICAGGRYDNLLKDLGGPDLKGVGFAFGIERLADLIEERLDYSHKVLCQLIPIGLNAKKHMIGLLQDLRISGITTDMNYDAESLKAHFKAADNNSARFIVILGDDELNKKTLKVKDKTDNKEVEINEEELINFIVNRLKCNNNCETCGGDCHEN